MNSLRTLYLGTRGQFSLIALQALLHAGVHVCAIVVPDENPNTASNLQELVPSPPVSDLPMVARFTDRSTVQVGWEHQIPVYELHDASATVTIQSLKAFNPDVALVACFPVILPSAFLSIPQHGFLNLHPSLLPAFRGPAPLFWAFRYGERVTGVTVHFMDEGVDTGDIILQAEIPLPDGITGAEAERRCAARGGELLVDALRQIDTGTISSMPQREGGTYYSWPTAADFHMPINWSARRAFNFMRGTAEWGRPYVTTLPGQTLLIESAVRFESDADLEAPYLIEDGLVRIRFNPGWLEAKLFQ